MHANIQTMRAVLYWVLIAGQRDFEKHSKFDTNVTVNNGYTQLMQETKCPCFSAEYSIPTNKPTVNFWAETELLTVHH
jgi:hypothetical protein